MRCDDARSALSAVLDGEAVLSPTAATHLTACGDCRAWHDEVRELERLFAAPVAVPDGVVPRVGRVRLLGPRSRRTAGRVLLVTALLAVPAGTAAARLRDRAPRPPAARQQAAPAPRATAPRATTSPAAPRATGPATTAPRPAVTTQPVAAEPSAPPAAPGSFTPPAPAKPLVAERQDGPLLLRLTTPAQHAGVLTATLDVVNAGGEPVTYDAPCADLLVAVDGEVVAPESDPGCDTFRTVTLAPGETRSVRVEAALDPGAYRVSGTLLRLPGDRERAGKLDTPPLRVFVS